MQFIPPNASVPHVSGLIDDGFNWAPNERSFRALRSAYQSTGGLARANDLSRILDEWMSGSAKASLIDLITSSDIFSLEWRSAQWIPMMQFHLDDMSLNPVVRQVRKELGDVLDGWELASWFVSRNDKLDERRPLDLMASELPAVLWAARSKGIATETVKRA